MEIKDFVSGNPFIPDQEGVSGFYMFEANREALSNMIMNQLDIDQLEEDMILGWIYHVNEFGFKNKYAEIFIGENYSMQLSFLVLGHYIVVEFNKEMIAQYIPGDVKINSYMNN